MHSITPGGTYTIPDDGFYILSGDANNTGQNVRFSVNGITILAAAPYIIATMYFKKGTVISTRNSSGQTYYAQRVY